MTASSYFNRVMFTAASSGSGSFVVSAAVTGYSTPAQRGVPNNSVVSYTAVSSDLTQWETGQGTYTSGNVTLTRTTIRESTNSGSVVSFNSPPTVWLDFHSEDIATLPLVGDVSISTQSGTSYT